MELFYLLSILFIIGYSMIIVEHSIRVNKAASALLMGIVSWAFYFHFHPSGDADKMMLLGEHLADITQILFFLIGGMTIVELISAHNGFDPLKRWLPLSSPKTLYWLLLAIGFWLSSALDNLTTMLVLISIVRQLIADKPTRQLLCAGLVFPVNAGGAWTPIGDVTTTMIWIEGRINTLSVMYSLFIPSLIAALVFGLLFMRLLPKQMEPRPVEETKDIPGRNLVLGIGVLGLIAVPIVKTLFHLPPFMGMLLSLSILWFITDRFHRHEERTNLRVSHILTKIDISCVLFFMGVLLAISALEVGGILDYLAVWCSEHVPNIFLFSYVMGNISALIDNVPLVAGIIRMYDVTMYPPDHLFWNLLAYCAGIGGSLMIIGSAPGVALMSLKDIRFMWYFKNVTWMAAVAFTIGWLSIMLFANLGNGPYG